MRMFLQHFPYFCIPTYIQSFISFYWHRAVNNPFKNHNYHFHYKLKMSQNQHDKKENTETRKGSTSTSKSRKTYNIIPAQVDEYKAPKDKIWYDVIRHERLLQKIWEETWAATIVPKELRPPNYPVPKITHKKLGEDAKSFYQPKPLSPIPVKSSALVGWRSSCPENSMEFFNVRYTSNKLRFVPQQYGYYRHAKYLSNGKPQESMEKPEMPAGKGIKHVVKVLLC